MSNDYNNNPSSQTSITASQNIADISARRGELLADYDAALRSYLKMYSDELDKFELGYFNFYFFS